MDLRLCYNFTVDRRATRDWDDLSILMFIRCHMPPPPPRIWKRAGQGRRRCCFMYTLILVSVRDADGGGRQPNPVPEVRPSVRRWADLPPPRGLGRRRAPYISSVGNETCPLPPSLSLPLSLPPSLHVSFPPFMQCVCGSREQRGCWGGRVVVYRWPDRHFSNGKQRPKGAAAAAAATNPCRLSRRRNRRTDHSARSSRRRAAIVYFTNQVTPNARRRR